MVRKSSLTFLHTAAGYFIVTLHKTPDYDGLGGKLCFRHISIEPIGFLLRDAESNEGIQ